MESNKSNLRVNIWKFISKIRLPFKFHHYFYKILLPNWQTEPQPVWFPDREIIKNSNFEWIMKYKNIQKIEELHAWSVHDISDFWQTMISVLKIQFDKTYSKIIDLSLGAEKPRWFCDARLNIVNSCFPRNNSVNEKYKNPNNIAIISQKENGDTSSISYQDLDILSNQIANSILKDFNPKESLAIIMPMNIIAVALYLGIVKAGCVVVSIADSFSVEEISLRLKTANAKGIFTQDTITRDNKKINLFDRVQQSTSEKIVLLSGSFSDSKTYSHQIIKWQDFIVENKEFNTIICQPSDIINILFSSGTTGEPKAIPWDHTTPIKCASDAFFHHNLKPGDRFCWPTNLGWMMGPWLIFATFINRATMLIYEGPPNSRGFGEFVQNQKVNHLGVIPSIVKHWKTTNCMRGLDWSKIKLLTSTAESSNPEDMLYLMYLAHYKPIIEYCGGTEVGGAYITGSVIQNCAASAFTMPAMGIDFVILDEHGNLSDVGEVALIPPSIGLSTELLNSDHHRVYFQDMPKYKGILLRRHGDQVQHYSNGFYRLQGRVDDTMNLGGIKVSCAEIERVLNSLAKIVETAAIAIEPNGGGPSELIIYAVLNESEAINEKTFILELQKIIKEKLNPLFKIHDLIIVKALPRTASNKIMRRKLRAEYKRKE